MLELLQEKKVRKEFEQCGGNVINKKRRHVQALCVPVAGKGKDKRYEDKI